MIFCLSFGSHQQSLFPSSSDDFCHSFSCSSDSYEFFRNLLCLLCNFIIVFVFVGSHFYFFKILRYFSFVSWLFFLFALSSVWWRGFTFLYNFFVNNYLLLLILLSFYSHTYFLISYNFSCSGWELVLAVDFRWFSFFLKNNVGISIWLHPSSRIELKRYQRKIFSGKLYLQMVLPPKTIWIILRI